LASKAGWRIVYGEVDIDYGKVEYGKVDVDKS